MLKVRRIKKASLFKERQDILHRELSSLWILIANYKQVILILIRSYWECFYEDQGERQSALKAVATIFWRGCCYRFFMRPEEPGIFSMGEWPRRPSSVQGDAPTSRQIGRQAEAPFSLIMCAWGRRRKTLVILDCEYFHFMTEARWPFTVLLEKLQSMSPVASKMKHEESPPFTSRNT